MTSHVAPLLHRLSRSTHPAAGLARRARGVLQQLHLPAPRLVYVPLLHLVLVTRAIWRFSFRVCVCEPLFKAYCREYGPGLRTDAFLHWVQGHGDIILGRNVTVDGKCGFTFAARFSARPTLRIGDCSGIGHGCSFRIGKAITIGHHCRIAGGVAMFDSSGHPSDPARRLAGASPLDAEVKPIAIDDNVWVGSGATIGPGVHIGEGSVVAAQAVVFSDVPPYTVVAGNPARHVMSLARPESR